MIPENPAMRLYSQWHAMLEYQGQRYIDDAKERLEAFSKAMREAKPSESWEDLRSDVEQNSLSVHQSYSSAPQVMLDYRMGLRLAGMSDRHTADENLLFYSIKDWKPVIQLSVRFRYSRSSHLMTLWPNGDFRIDTPPHEGNYIMFPRWTFFRTSWVASSRAWLPAQPSLRNIYGASGWVKIDPKDFQTAVPYVGRHAFRRGAHYRLTWDGHFWRFTSQYGCADGNYSLKDDYEAQKVLRAEYDRCERRYERYRRLSISGASESRTRKVAIYVPKQGRMTGLEAVQHFQQHMRVYERPTKATYEEATNGSASAHVGVSAVAVGP